MSRARELFRRHHLAVFRYLVRAAGDRDRAEELTQEVFLRVIRGLASYRAEGREEAWIFTIARNVALDARARRAQNREAAADGIALEGSQPARADLRGRLAAALECLQPVERDAFLMREIGGLSYAEIAATGDATVDAVRARIYRARRTLREALGDGRGGNLRTFRARTERSP